MTDDLLDDLLDDGECCWRCGTQIFFHGEAVIECLNCGAIWSNAEADEEYEEDEDD